MEQFDFAFLQTFMKTQSGLHLTDDKMYLIESRLTPVASKFGYSSISQLINALRTAPKPDHVTAVVEAMATHETSFFRDKTPFEHLQRAILPALSQARAGAKRLRIWCAACSSGQEPYSLAMLLDENATLFPGWSIEIVATDISRSVLQKAEAGVFSQFEVQRGLAIQRLVKYFDKQDANWRAKDSLRKYIRWQYANLLQDTGQLGSFDIVLCRNVLIYFDRPTRGKVFDMMASRLASDGVLVLGSTESILGVTARFQGAPGFHGVYTPVGGKALPPAQYAEQAGKTARTA